MREENQDQTKAVKFADQNQAPNKPQSGKNGGVNNSKPRSSWGSNIVKGFTADKRNKLQNTVVMSKKLPLSNSDVASQNGSIVSSHSRVKRSLIGDLSCSVNPAQIHPHSYQTHRRQSSGSRDLFLELDSLRSLLQESKEREFKLQAELSELKRSPQILEIERELEVKKSEADELLRRVRLLEEEKTSLAEQLSLIIEKNKGESLMVGSCSKNLEMEVVELRRLNKELQMQKRDLACKLSSMESQLTSLAKASESDIVAKIKAEASLLRHTNEDLCKQVEGLQISRLNEVEELAYLRWVNSCLRDELQNSGSTEKESSFDSAESVCEIVGFQPSQNNECLEFTVGKRLSLIKKLKKWPNSGEDVPSLECPDNLIDKAWVELEEERSPRRRHSISGLKCSVEELTLRKRRQSDGFMCTKDMEKEEEPLASQNYDFGIFQRSKQISENCLKVNNINKTTGTFDVEKRALRIPNPPPRPSCSVSSGPKEEGSAQIPLPPPPLLLPPPPPPPPKYSVRSTAGLVQRAPQVVEFYHSLMKRDSRKDSSNGAISEAPDVANVRSSMIGEIENRSSHLLAIKADVATQGEFVNSLIKEVNNAVYQSIEDVVAFVKWLDDELCFLVDERAVLKHFDWPEKKADTLREAAFGYRDLKKLETEVSYYKDDPRVPCDMALKKMVALSEKMERTVYNLLRTRESLMRNCKEFQIPTDWMLDNGITSKIKFGSVKLAKKYMKRVAMELQSKTGMEKDPAMDYMLLQGVRFAFRIHQFAGGFDAETMHAFEELRNIAHHFNKK
ncbi:protein CHUP1, chloroplastic-like [Mangifera indica]|uniref:protein CHUP1, chloroplastic-like n=1 Tax=Mangifera indica TaxID=29780 RepID=UPI001CFBE16C|nr:protein CHUP1, chloroplastic-like [Mangifera indica]